MLSILVLMILLISFVLAIGVLTSVVFGRKSIIRDMGERAYSGDMVHLEPIDGKGTTTITIKEHIKILGVKFVLKEVPDGGATTYTAKLTDGTNDICAARTFTQGTEVAGDPLEGAMDDTYWELRPGDTLEIVTAGTTTTAGELIAHIFGQRQ